MKILLLVKNQVSSILVSQAKRRKRKDIVYAKPILKAKPKALWIIGMVINFTVAIVVSRMTDSPPIEIRKLVDSIRVPRGAAEPSDH